MSDTLLLSRPKRGKTMPQIMRTKLSAAPSSRPSKFVRRQISLTQLPEELQCRITGYLDVLSLERLGATNRALHELSRRNQAGWTHRCRELWNTKVHVCTEAQQLLASNGDDENDDSHQYDGASSNNSSSNTSYQAYRLSCRDAQERQAIRTEEFCYDPETGKGTIWSFRFKESAGPDWTSVDPWYQDLPCRQMVFLSDGRCLQYIRQQDDDDQLVDPPVPIAWRFLEHRPMDLPERPRGSYVRLSVAGRDVPTYSVRRAPNGNWAFVMESCWGLYASYPLPPRQRRLLRRSGSGDATWVNACHADPLQDDSQLQVTNKVQWREAFLYNVGVRTLPSGDCANEEFSRIMHHRTVS